MTRRCSHCSHNGHNSRTCPNQGVKLFGVRLTDGSIRKSASIGNLSQYASFSGGSDGWASPAKGSDRNGDAAEGFASKVSHRSRVLAFTSGRLQLTEKSDIYSFGIILLELIMGHEPISNENFGANYRNIITWAKSHIDSGNIQAIIDPLLDDDYDMQSIWKIMEAVLACVKPQGIERSSISNILKEIQEAISIERDLGIGRDYPTVYSKTFVGSFVNLDPINLDTLDRNASLTGMFGVHPGLGWF